LGAKVVLTPAAEKGTGMLNKAIELAEAHGWYLCRQFENEANAEVHTRTTAREILADFEGESLHAFVSGFGTGGTLLGVARGLKAADPRIRVIAAEPDNSPVLGSGVPQPRDAQGQPNGSHPYFRPHLMQGWSPDFVARLTEDAMAEKLVDEVVPVDGNEALRLARALATQEGIFAGTSSGATLAAALTVAKRSAPGSNIVCMLPDTGERYLSTPLFEGIDEDMNDEEAEISRSTPGYRFDAPAVCAMPRAAGRQPNAPPEIDPEAAAFVERVVRDEPVVVFALEWCEFCWAVRKLFTKLSIAYRSVDLDSVAFQAGDLGVKIRAALKERAGSPTIPQVFIGGRHVGGCTELFDAMADGSMQQLLGEAGVEFDRDADLDPHGLLPRWVHPRKTA
jgi:cysteine synthase A